MGAGVTIVSTCRMGPGTFEAKFVPLSRVNLVERIIVVRKERGPNIPKLDYYVLPKIYKNPIVNAILTPFIIARQVRLTKAAFILAYHYVPHYYLAYFASKLSGIPYILGQTGSDDQKLALRPIKGLLLRTAIKGAMYLNVPGSGSARFWNSLGYRNINILHSTIDTDHFTPSYGEKEFDFIYIGRLEDYKGVHKIITAMQDVVRKHPTAKLAIVGYGSQEEDLKKMVQQLDLTRSISFHGFQADTREWLWKAKIFVMASDTEGLPCALMEAMSCGLICISSEVGNVGDILIDGKTGYCYHAEKNDILTNQMLDALSRVNESSGMQQAAREIIVREHSYQKSIALWSKIIMDRVLSNG